MALGTRPVRTAKNINLSSIQCVLIYCVLYLILYYCVLYAPSIVCSFSCASYLVCSFSCALSCVLFLVCSFLCALSCVLDISCARSLLVFFPFIMLKTQFLSYSHQSESILSVDYCILILCILFHVYSFMGI